MKNIQKIIKEIKVVFSIGSTDVEYVFDDYTFLSKFIEFLFEECDNPDDLTRLESIIDIDYPALLKLYSNPNLSTKLVDKFADRFSDVNSDELWPNKLLAVLKNPSISGEKLDELARKYNSKCEEFNYSYAQILFTIIQNSSVQTTTLDFLVDCNIDLISNCAQVQLSTRNYLQRSKR